MNLSIAYAVCCFSISSFTMDAYLKVKAAEVVDGKSTEAAWIIPGIAFFAFVLPLGLAAILANEVERWFRACGNFDRSPRWSWRTVLTALAFLSPFICIPILLVIRLAERVGLQ